MDLRNNPKNGRTERVLLDIKTVSTLLGLSRSSIYGLIKDGFFPAPLKVGERASRWHIDDVDAFIESLAAKRR